MVLSKADVEKFVSRFENAVKDPKMRKMKRLEIARLYKDAKLPQKAKECIEEYMTINRKDHRALNLLGAVNEDLGQWEDALKCYKKSIELACTQKDIFIRIIEAYSKVPLTEPEIAKVWADKAAKVFPNHPSVFHLKWSLMMCSDERDYDEMEDILAQELVANPRDVSLHIKLVKLYIEKDDLDEAYEHCSSITESKIFQTFPEWLKCAAYVFENVYKKKKDPAERIEAYMKYIPVLCLMVENSMKKGAISDVKPMIQKLDKAVNETLKLNQDSLPENFHIQLEVFQGESQAQFYFYLAEFILKMMKEGEISWTVAAKFSFGLFSICSSIKEPNPKSPWLIHKSMEKHNAMLWYSMACKRLSQTNHQILSLLKMNGDKWIKNALLDACCEAGKKELIEMIYDENRDISNSFFAKDKEFLKPEFKAPDIEELIKYDEISIKDNPEDFGFLVWIGVNWHFLCGSINLEAVRLVGNIFFDITMDADNIKNCSPFSVSSKDIEVFIEAVIYSSYKRFAAENQSMKDKSEAVLPPAVVSPEFVTSSQKELWDAIYKLHLGKTWQTSTSKLKSIVQKGLETLRVIDNHGIDPRILKYISDTFLSKAEEMTNDNSKKWKNQAHLESLQKRGYYYAIESLKLLESSHCHNEVSQPKRTLIQPLPKPLKDGERQELITEIRMSMADAAFRENLHKSALKYLGELYTADSAYKEAQVYRDLATKENLTNIEGLRNHLSNLRKSRERLLTCLSRLDETQESLRSGVQAEIDEIRDAIAEQSGISAAPSKILDFRYSTSEEYDEGEGRSFEDETQQVDETNTDSKLALENSMLHEQLAVRNHEFSVLAQRIYKLEREIVDLRKNQSGNESIIGAGNNSTSLSGATDESSSSIVHAPKDDATSGSGNLTPRLEPEMSWDPFSPAPVYPVFDKGFFSGLADTVDKIDEETEEEVQEETKANEIQNDNDDENDASKDNADDVENIHVEPVVQLTQISNQKSGEEEEQLLFMERAKLYRLSDKQWKERGVGDLKILLNPKTHQSRIVMRRDHILRLCANHVITSDIKMTKKDGSLTTFVWYTVADMSEQDVKPETFAVRFKTQEIAEKFLKVFTNCQNKEAVHDGISPTRDDVTSKLSSSLNPKAKEVPQAAKDDKKSKEEKSFALASAKFNFSAEQDERPKEENKKVDFSGFKFNLGDDASKKPNDETKEEVSAKTQQSFKFTPSKLFSTENQNRNEERKFNFSNASFKFGDNNKEISNANNPFLAASNNLFSIKNQTNSPLNFTNNQQQQPSAQFTIDSPFSFGKSTSSNPATQSTPKISFPIMQSEDQSASQRDTSANSNQGNVSNIFGQTPATSSGPAVQGSASNYESITDQNAYFQSNWEAAQDQYYCEGAYADQDQYYADEYGYYDNEEYYNGSGYYSNDNDDDDEDEDGDDDDDDDDDDGNLYYANDDGAVDFYDQEAVKPITNGDSDANSDRQSPENHATNQEEPVPRVVQMIDEDVFVTFVKKASFVERAKSSRFLLPTTFFSPNSKPPCTGCIGCSKSKPTPVLIEASTTESSKLSHEKSDKQNVFASKVTLNSGSFLGANLSSMSFADFVKSNQNSPSLFQNKPTTTSFSGAGSVLFSSDKKDDGDSENYDPHYKAIIELEKKENQSTGEEGYLHLFKHRAKLYRFDSESKQWKERGVGDMKLSYNPSNNYCRVIMRRDIIHKICANHPIMPDIILKQHELSSTSLVWVSGADYSEGEPTVEKFAVKFKNIEICNEFKRVFEECQKKMVSYVDNLKKMETKGVKKVENETALDADVSNKLTEKPTNEEGQIDFRNQTETDNVAKQSIWSKFASKEGSWVCEVCEVKNSQDKVQCVSCNTTKPGAKVTQADEKDGHGSGTVFGAAKLFGSSKPISFPTPTFSGSSIVFGQPTGATSTVQGSASSKDSSSTSKVEIKTVSPATKNEPTKQDSEVKNSSSVWSKFSAKDGLWICDVCEVKNTSDKNVCVSCNTAKPGVKVTQVDEKDDHSSGIAFGAAKLFGSSKPISFPTSKFSGSSIVFGQPVEVTSSVQGVASNKDSSSTSKADIKTDQKLTFAPKADTSMNASKTVSSATKNEPTKQDSEMKNSSSVWSRFSAKDGIWICDVCEVKNTSDKNVCVSCNTLKAGSNPTSDDKKNENNSGFVFGASKPVQTGFLFGSSKPVSFGTPSASSSPFTFASPANQFSFTKKPEIGASQPQTETKKDIADWECPTCSVNNDKSERNCTGCKTENPSFKDKILTPIALKKSPINEKTQKSDLKYMFASKPGSGECPTCLIQHDITVHQCSACTTAKPNNEDQSSAKLFTSNMSSSFSTPQNNSGFTFCFTNQTPSSQNESANRSMYFTPAEQFTSDKKVDKANEGEKTFHSNNQNDSATTPDSPSKRDDHSLNFSPIVELKRKEDRKTGEELEDVVFAEKVKLYRFDIEAKQWKERGIGELKILFKKESGKYRIVMRRDQVHKLCANHYLVKGMCLKAMENSEKAFIWTTAADYCDEEAKSEMFAAKFKSIEQAKDFEKAFVNSVSGTGDSKDIDERKCNDDSNRNLEKNEIAIEEGKLKDIKEGKADDVKEGQEKDIKEGKEKDIKEGEVKDIKEEQEEDINEKKEKDIKEEQTEVPVENKGPNEKEFDLKVTYQFVPDQEDQTKAGKLLLPKEFFHLPATELKSSSNEQQKSSNANEKSLSSPVKYEAEEECKAVFKPLVELNKVQFKTGEESDEIIFCEKAKVYRLDSSIPQWKERGSGDLKILKNQNTGQARLIMRRDQVKKLCLNHLIVNGMKLEDSEMSKRTVVWFTLADYSEDEAKPEKFAARFKTDNTFNQFKICFLSAVADLTKEITETCEAKMDKTEANECTIQVNTISETDNDTVYSDEDKTSLQGEDVGYKQMNNENSQAEETSKITDPKAPFSFNFLSSHTDASLEPNEPQKTLFDISSKSSQAKFEFPSSNLFSFGSLRSSDGQQSNIDGKETNMNDVAESISDPKTGKMFDAFDWSKPMGNLFSFSTNEREEKPNVEDDKESNNTEKPKFTWTLEKSMEKQPSEQQINKSVEVKSENKYVASNEEKYITEEECKANFEAIVKLEKMDQQKTGEENEGILFCEKAKAYRYDVDGPQWKERGTGEIKILKNLKNEQYRILMRRDQVKKICINHIILSEMKMEKNEASRNSWVWFCHADYSEEIPKPEKFAIRFRNEDASCRFKESFDQAKSEILAAKEAGDDAEKRVINNIRNINKEKDKGIVETTVEIYEKVLMNEQTDNSSKEKIASDVVTIDEIEITYVKEVSNEDREMAHRFLLPSMFFTTDNLIQRISKSAEKTEISIQDQSTSSSTMSPFTFKTTGLCFSDLNVGNSDGKSAFRINKNQHFDNQGQVLFQTTSENEEPQVHFTPIVTLAKKEIKTGEENEESLFDERCKLYRYDNNAIQWKERGIGRLKILHNKTKNNHRIIMRRDQVFKICANHLINIDMKPVPRQGLETTWLWKTNADISDGAAQEEMFTARFKSAEIGKTFAETIEKCCAALQSIDQSMNEGRSVKESINTEEENANVSLESHEKSVNEAAAADDVVNEPIKNEEDSSNVSFKSIFKSSMDGWECNGCYVINKWNINSCIACGYQRNDEAKQESQNDDNLQDDHVTSTSSLQKQANDCNNKGSNDVNAVKQEDSETVNTTEENQFIDSKEHTFGSSFSSLSFASIANTNSNETSFQSPKNGGFSGVGRVLFSGANETSEKEIDPHFEPIVQLAKVETKSGEENEEVLFESRVKLYKFNSESKQWKERGIGVMKLMRHIDNGRARLVMRREQVHKLCANHALTDGMKLERMTSSNRTLMWKTLADVSDGDSEEALLAARFKSDDVMNEFQRVFEMLCEKRKVGKKREEEKNNDENTSVIVGSCCPSISADLQDLLTNK